MPCQTVSINGGEADVDFTMVDVTGGVNKVDIEYDLMNNTSATAVVTVAFGVDRDGDGSLTGDEIFHTNEHTMDPNSPINWRGDWDVGGVPPGETQDVQFCVEIVNLEFQ